MSVCIVHLLEMIKIDEYQRELIIVALRAVDFRLEDSLHVPGILECDGCKVGKSLEKLQVALVKTFRAEAIDQLNDPEAGVAEFNRDGNDRLRFGLGLLVYLREETSVLRSVRHDHGLAVLRHPAGNSLAHLNAYVFERLGSLAHSQFEVEFLFFFIEQQKRPVVRAQKLVYFLHNGAENLVELQRRGQRLPQLLEDGDFARFALLGGHRRIAAAFHGWKLLYFVHARLISAIERLTGQTLAASADNTTRAIRGWTANLCQYRRVAKRGARISWYRRGHLAIGRNGACPRPSSPPGFQRTKELRAPSRRTRQPESMS